MCLNYSFLFDNLEGNQGNATVNHATELINAKRALRTFYEVGANAIQRREAVGNKFFNGIQGGYEKYHIILNEHVVEILEFFHNYNDTYVCIFSHCPDTPTPIENES